MTALGLEVQATDGAARTAVVTTARGSFSTPCFMPVGTRGSVRTLSSVDLEGLGAEVMLANTYHLMLRPGTDVVESLGGVHGFASWPGHVLTDSGGYQVFSLQPDVDDDGVTFKSTYDGSSHRLTPESAVSIQESLGATSDGARCLCAVAVVARRAPGWPSSGQPRGPLGRGPRTAERIKRYLASSREVSTRICGASASRTVAIGFDGYGIGGLSVGESRDEMLPALRAALAPLPAHRPRYLMGVGDPARLVDAVGLGIDMFDCVLPTRLARHGSVLTSAGRLPLRNAAFARDPGPLDPECRCAVCGRWSRAYLRHLLQVREPSALRLVTLHNLAWTLDLVRRARSAVEAGTLAALRRDIAAVWH